MATQAPQDPTDYTVVETGPASWGLLYARGEFYGGFSTKELAMEQAQVFSAGGTSASPTSVVLPTSIEQAQVLAQAARDNYRLYLANTPSPTAESTQPYLDAITQYDSYVSSFAGQQGLARTQVTATDNVEAIQAAQRVTLADNTRRFLSQQAVDLRSTTTDSQLWAAADQRAFDSERYYQNLLAQNSASSTALTSSYVTTADPTFASTSYGIPNSQLVQRTTVDPLTTGSIVDVSKLTANSAASTSTGTLSAGSLLTDYTGQASKVSSAVATNVGSLSSALDGITQSVDSAFASNGGTSIVGNSTSTTASTTASEKRVRISPKSALSGTLFTGLLEPLATTKGMVFPYTPTITNQASANYNTITTVHANQDWHIYQNTPSVQLVINGIFTAQNETEAKYLLASMHFLRAVTKMHFGDSDTNKGLPPPQLLLDGYGTYMYNALSVIINSYNVDMPNNVDYVDVSLGGAVSQVPTVTNITVTCTVQNTPKKSREFNWDKFASGELMKSGKWI